MCEEPQTCDANEAMLLSDMSPYGQYGRLDYTLTYDDNQDIIEPIQFVDNLSVFNDANQLYHDGEINDPNDENKTFTWRNPEFDYKEDGFNSLVEVTWVNDKWLPEIALDELDELVEAPNFGSTFNSIIYGNLVDGKYYIHPKNLKHVTDFVTNWKTDWAQSLLAYHPESCYLAYNESICERTFQSTTSFEFDTLLSTTITYADAVTAGFIPTTASSTSNIVNSDPFFNTTYLMRVVIMTMDVRRSCNMQWEQIMMVLEYLWHS